MKDEISTIEGDLKAWAQLKDTPVKREAVAKLNARLKAARAQAGGQTRMGALEKAVRKISGS